MRSKIIVLPLVAFLALSACGGGGEDEAEKNAGKSGVIEKVFADPLTDDQIEKALLTVEDLPSGYSVQKDDEDEDDSESSSTSDNPKCDAFLNELNDEDDTEPFGEGDVTFAESDFGPFLMQSISSQEGSAIKDAFGDFEKAMLSCDSFTETDAEGTKTEYTVSKMSFPEMGDDSLAVKLDMDSDGFEISAPMIIIRVDQNLVVLVSVGFGGAMSGEELEKVAGKAVAKVKAVA